MKYNAFFKFVAIVLSIVCAVGVIAGGICVFVNLNYGYYTNSPQQREEEAIYWHSQQYADCLIENALFDQSGMPREIWEHSFGNGYLHSQIQPEVDYRLVIATPEGIIEIDRTRDMGYAHEIKYETYRDMGYAIQVGENDQLYPEYLGGDGYNPEPTHETMDSEEIVPTTMPETVPTEVPEMMAEATVPPGFDVFYNQVFDNKGNYYRVYRSDEPVLCTVELFYTAAEYENVLYTWGSGMNAPFAEWMYEFRYEAIGITAGSLVLLLLLMTYLAFAAGRKSGTDEIRPGGLNRMPLDLYTALCMLVGFFPCWALFEPIMQNLFDLDQLWTAHFMVLLLSGLGCCALIGLVCILYWCALCAQLKAEGFWWKKSLIGRFGNGIWNFIKGIFRRIWRWILGLGGKKKDGPTLTEMIRDFNSKLPLMWQWLAASMMIFVLLAVFGRISYTGIGLFFYLIAVVIAVLAILYGARAFGALRDAAKRMSQGNLDVKINPDTLEGGFRDFAHDLNALSDACITAAREQMKSERMKTELITNVSHDIKTPLTSIINYVDLLKKAQTEEERQQYLEVLERQSAQLKKLIEDLMEMSKATTGNVAVELAPTDVTESVNQALGEYADRFASRQLNVLVHKPEEPVFALCDGKLLWRVLSNVMSNVVKYAMPGTRVYLDLSVTEFRVQITMKNISREELNITAGELMERFVRGDKARNTEGNGLGLNIAQGLMEVQNGTLELLVDGDLFKVILTLPRAEDTGIIEN